VNEQPQATHASHDAALAAKDKIIENLKMEVKQKDDEMAELVAEIKGLNLKRQLEEQEHHGRSMGHQMLILNSHPIPPTSLPAESIEAKSHGRKRRRNADKLAVEDE
jgi:seryl-tRNA synthetase